MSLGEKAAAFARLAAAESFKRPVSILTNKKPQHHPSKAAAARDRGDPLAVLAQGGGSKRNALLKWCQAQTVGYPQVIIIYNLIFRLNLS